MAHDKKRLLVLISGSGSNLQAFIDQCASGQLDAQIVAVIANKADAYGLVRAEKAGIAQQLIDHRQYANREQFDRALGDAIEHYQPDLIILAGFMRILTAGFVQRFYGKLLNIHPSLLPKYPGLDTHQRAIDAGDSHAGATVHFVTAELDGGPPIVQAQVTIAADDTAQSLANKVLQLEHHIYPLAACWFVQGRLALHQDSAWLDQQKLPPTGHILVQA